MMHSDDDDDNHADHWLGSIMRRRVACYFFPCFSVESQQRRALSTGVSVLLDCSPPIEEPSVSSRGTISDYEILNVDRYLSCVAEAISPKPIRLNETHRKPMMRTLTGYLDLDSRVRDHKNKLQWQRAIDFSNNNLVGLKDMRIPGAQGFQEGLTCLPFPYKHFQSPIKWFSYMASGKKYQGRFLWLLADIAPELISEYSTIAEILSNKEAVKSWLNANNLEYREAALKLNDFEFRKQYSTRNGLAEGKRGESLLFNFMQERRTTGDQIVQENVLVKPRSKRGSGVIVYKPVVLGMTTEFDGMLIEKDGNRIRILEAWEAKSNINPASLYDTSVKKFTALQSILQDDSSRFVLDNQSFALHRDIPVFGLFGTSLYSPSAAASRINAFGCLRLISSDVNAVLSAIQTGYITITREEMMKEVAILQSAMNRINLVIAMPKKGVILGIDDNIAKSS